jgi:hypothetical protein
MLLEEFPERDAREIFHDQVRNPCGFTLIEHIDNVRVTEPRGASSLLLKPSREIFVIAEMCVHDLDGHTTPKPEVISEIDHCHAAACNARTHHISIVERLPDERIDWGRGHPAILFGRKLLSVAARRLVRDPRSVV